MYSPIVEFFHIAVILQPLSTVEKHNALIISRMHKRRVLNPASRSGLSTAENINKLK